MIQQLENLFRRWGILPPFDKDDVLNASIENKARDNEKVIERLQTLLSRRFEINERLRQSIKIAKRRTNSFEEFEQYIVGRTDDNTH
jgi:hypothetical protein